MKMPVIAPPRRPMQMQARFATPIGGLNYVSNFMDFPATDAYLLDNLIPRTNGVEIRKGWARWTPEIGTSDPYGNVRSLMAYNAAKIVDSRLFMSDELTGKVWNITTPQAAPVVSLTPSTNSNRAGEWYDTHYHNDAGTFLCIVSAGAGYFTYDAAGGWVDRSANITFPAPYNATLTAKDICFIWTWKNRIWFLVKDSPVAFYLPLTAIQGALAAFDFGQQLARGGPLSFGATWTYDAGNGIDDSLVLVSEQGEVLIYQGTDPSNASTFSLKGVWYIGDIPVGRRGYASHGGSLLVLCTYGLVAMEDVIAGRITSGNLSSGLGAKINQALSTRIAEHQDEYYWHITIHPAESLMILATPIYVSELGTYQELAMNSINNAWCTLTGMDIYCSIVWQGQFLFGTRGNGVKLGFYGYQDNIDIDQTEDGDDITGRFQNAFNDFQTSNDNKRMLRIKMYGLLENTDLSFLAKFQPEYQFSTNQYPTPLSSGALPFWDVAIWDEAFWALGAGSFHQWFGVTGFGKKLSLQFAIRGRGKVICTDYEALWEKGIGL